MGEPLSLAIDQLPGYRRRIRITPSAGAARAELEDDYHHMAVTLRHENGIVTEAIAEQTRAPWTTCPGAIAQLAHDFNGVLLADIPRSKDVKLRNCTHLHDLATLAADHARDERLIEYDMFVSDPILDRRLIELRKNGSPVMQWVEQNGRLVSSAAMNGLTILHLNDWIRTLTSEEQEYARLLRWGARIAYGRLIPLEQQSDATTMPLSCYTFQPHISVGARRIGVIRDFSGETTQPLDPFPD
jgi:hypothetical protein